MYNKLKYPSRTGDFMASQFRNSNLGYYLYTTIVILIGAASIFVFWFMVSGFNIGRYAENTNIGSVYLGGLTEQEAELELKDKIESWLRNDRVLFEVRYQGYHYVFDRDLISFNENESLANIQDGRTVPLDVWYPDTIRAQILFEIENQPFMANLQDQFDLEALLDDILQDASQMKTFSSKQLIDYVRDEENLFIVLFETTQSRPNGAMGPLQTPSNVNGTALYNKLINAYPNGITINRKSTFSILDTFDPNTFNDAELSYLASLFLDMLPYTHFMMYERNYRPVIDTNLYTAQNYPFYGRNVRVRASQDIDFSFENNSFSHFRVEFEQTGNFINLRLYGAPFLNQISVAFDMTTIPYLTETVSPTINERDGVDGRVVKVYRNVYDLNEELLSRTRVVFESYRPRTAFIHE